MKSDFKKNFKEDFSVEVCWNHLLFLVKQTKKKTSANKKQIPPRRKIYVTRASVKVKRKFGNKKLFLIFLSGIQAEFDRKLKYFSAFLR